MRVFRRSRGARTRRPLRVWRRRTGTPSGPDTVRRIRPRPSQERGRPDLPQEHVRRARDRIRPARDRVRLSRDRVRLFWERWKPPRPVLLALAFLPGLAAVLALVMCASGVDRTGHRRERAPVTARPALPHQAPRPPIVPRTRWLAGDAHSQPPARYDDRVAAVFVHHTDSPNDYDCADAPRLIRYLYAGQTDARNWDDIGYNFLVDRCGTVYEGRAGGVDRPVTGAHTQGFNHRTTGVAALGTFTAGVAVPRAMTDAIAALAAWKLGLSGSDPRGSVRLTSSNSLSRYANGTTALLPTLAGHSDGYMTDCPGAALAERLPSIRELAARLQGRR